MNLDEERQKQIQALDKESDELARKRADLISKSQSLGNEAKEKIKAQMEKQGKLAEKLVNFSDEPCTPDDWDGAKWTPCGRHVPAWQMSNDDKKLIDDIRNRLGGQCEEDRCKDKYEDPQCPPHERWVPANPGPNQNGWNGYGPRPHCSHHEHYHRGCPDCRYLCELSQFRQHWFYDHYDYRWRHMHHGFGPRQFGFTGTIAIPNTTFEQWLYWFNELFEAWMRDYNGLSDLMYRAIVMLEGHLEWLDDEIEDIWDAIFCLDDEIVKIIKEIDHINQEICDIKTEIERINKIIDNILSIIAGMMGNLENWGTQGVQFDNHWWGDAHYNCYGRIFDRVNNKGDTIGHYARVRIVIKKSEHAWQKSHPIQDGFSAGHGQTGGSHRLAEFTIPNLNGYHLVNQSQNGNAIATIPGGNPGASTIWQYTIDDLGNGHVSLNLASMADGHNGQFDSTKAEKEVYEGKSVKGINCQIDMNFED